MPRPYTRYPCGIYGPRNLVRRHARKLKRRLLAEARGETAAELPLLPPGQEQLFSFYSPALEAGEYTISLGQDIVSAATSESLPLPLPNENPVTQKFDVVAPKFSLPPEAIHGSFPPQGYGALANTLPHVVLADPHLPWARIASALPNSSSSDWQRNQVPWLALLVFTADELTLSASQLSGEGSLFKNTGLAGGAIQSQTGTINVNISDVSKIQSTISPISALPSEPSDDKSTDLIFVPSGKFQEFFTSYDENGNQVPQTGPDVSRYKYLSHVRDINTTGMADAGVEDNGVFGVVVSHRTGPLSNTQPQPVIAHLVSIEGVESAFMNGKWPLDPSPTEYVAMTSLYSWTFVTLPEGSFNAVTTFQKLGNGVNVLRAPDTVIKSIDTTTRIGQRLQQRLIDGYTLTKYRTATGETTAAIYRGPFTPTLVPYPLMPGHQGRQGSTWLSNSGIDLQIMDPKVGLMDVTYAVAWQLGKTLAVADSVFTTSLGKLRSTIYKSAMNNAKAEILQERGLYKDRDDTIVNLSNTIPNLRALHKDLEGLHRAGSGMGDRWQKSEVEQLDLTYRGPLVQKIFQRHADAVGEKLTLSSDGDGAEKYDEQNTPSSTDWMVVLTWVLDKMFLYNIPAHYLIIDPTYLAPETLRFFHIDRNWTDALVDGALSLGNTMMGTDQVRQTIHQMISDYLYPSQPPPVAPQIPLYGFLMHSQAVTQYPDLKVNIKLKGVSGKAPILRHENLDVPKGVMICLLDQTPGNPGLQSVTFTQPPHQQSFVAGAELDSRHIQTLYKRIYTLEDQRPNPDPWASNSWLRPEVLGSSTQPKVRFLEGSAPHSKTVFKWGSNPDPDIRTLLPGAWTTDVNRVLNFYGTNPNDPSKPLYHDDVPNAALAGIQLNNPIYQLVIGEADSSLESTPSEEFTVVDFPSPVQTAAPHPLGTSARKESAPHTGYPLTLVAHRPKHGQRRAFPQLPGPRAGQDFHLGPGHGAPGPPPHSRPNRAGNMGPIFGQPVPPDDPDLVAGAGAPQYAVTCVPSDNDPDHPGIPTGTGIPKDLIFQIVQDPDSVSPHSDYKLLSFKIVLELAGGTPPRWDRCLLSEYTGPGPFMLSNLRFNVLAQIFNDKDRRYLALILLPRSTSLIAMPEMCKQMSFMLPVCRILKHNVVTQGRIPVFITPEYKDRAPVTTTDYYVLNLAQN